MADGDSLLRLADILFVLRSGEVVGIGFTGNFALLFGIRYLMGMRFELPFCPH